MIEPDLIELAQAIGVAFGALYGLSGFADTGRTNELARNPRVRNLRWLLAGAGGVGLGDWGLISPTEVMGSDRALLLLDYGIAALAAGFGVIALVSLAIVLSLGGRIGAVPALSGRRWELVLEYWQHGYQGYRTLLGAIETRAQSDLDGSNAMGKLGALLSSPMAAGWSPEAPLTPEIRSVLIDLTLRAMEDTVRLFAPGESALQIKSNYMACVSLENLRDATPLFVDRPLEEYAGFLVLRRYREGRRISVCLPLESASGQKRVLPGAPACVGAQEGRLIDLNDLTFEANVPAALRREVRTFFGNATYGTVLSVPLIRGGGVVGVANLETDGSFLARVSKTSIGDVWQALSPFCLMLGDLVYQSERDL